MTMSQFMISRLNGRKWVVARQSEKLSSKGYEVFLSQKQFTALKDEARAAGVLYV